MNKLFCVSWLVLGMSVACASAQVAVDSKKQTTNNERVTKQGKWTFATIDHDVLKINFVPKGYTRTQQISDAILPDVLKKQQNMLDAKTVKFHQSGSITILAKQAALIDSLQAYSDCINNGFSFLLRPGEQIFGGGERALPMNRRGYRFNFYNDPAYGYGVGQENLNYSLPFFISNKGYGVFFDNPSKGFADIGKSDSTLMKVGFESGELTFYVIKGNSAADILHKYASLIGTQPIPGRWVFGNFMTRFGYRSQQQVTDMVAKMRAERMPMDAVIIDLFWFGDSIQNYVGNLDWVNKQKWPDPKAMIADLKHDSLKTILITEPYVVKNTLNYDESKSFLATDSLGKVYTLQNFYFGKGGIIDMFRTDAQDWFWTKYKKQIEMGVSGWWGDLGEPENHPADVYHSLSDLGYKSRLYSSNEVHNIFGHYWNKMLYTHYEKEYPDVRLFNLNRAGYAASARYIIFPWTGDVGRNWSGFRAQLPLMLTMSMSNIPYVHSDAGGFTFAEANPELYVRWLQMSSFSPVLRPHGTALEDLLPNMPSSPSEPATFGEPYKSIARRYVQLRYNLLPYNYTLGYDHYANAKPLVRPLFFNSFADVDAVKAEDQYFWGDAFVIAPVLESKAATRHLYLPKGESWYNFHSPKAPIVGGVWLDIPVTLDDMPIFVKAGSFIPSTSGLMRTDAYNAALLKVTYYPSAKASLYTLFDDDGKTNKSWEKKQFELISFKSDGKNNFTISSNGGVYPGKPAMRKFAFVIVNQLNAPKSVLVNGKRAKVIYNAENQTITVNVEFTGKPVNISVK